MKEGGRKEVESSIKNKDEHHRVRKKYMKNTLRIYKLGPIHMIAH